jgi:biotin carboxylase
MTSRHPAAVWLIAGGAMQRPAAEKIKALGYALILTDGSSSCALRPMADEFVHLDTFDMAGNSARADALKTRYDIRAVFTAGADCHETVAVLARHLGLHGIDPAIAHLCRFKNLTRERLRGKGIPQPLLLEASSHEQALTAAAQVGFPIALKATDNSGSRGFSRIERKEDLTRAGFQRARDNGTTGIVIVEELLLPQPGTIAEQSVETVWYDGQMGWLNWVDRLFRKDFDSVAPPWNAADDPYRDISWAVELGHLNPAEHGLQVRQEVEALVRRAGEAIGMGAQKGGHILKADIMLTTKGPMILELTPRLSGGWDSAHSTPERGADFIGGALHLALGEKLDESIWRNYFTYREPERRIAVLAQIRQDAQDCIGREFAWGAGPDRARALEAAYRAYREERFLV